MPSMAWRGEYQPWYVWLRNVPCEDGWELVPCEEGWAPPPCGGGLVGELFWDIGAQARWIQARLILKQVALTGVCDGCVDVSTKLGTPPKIGGRFLKCLE
jgi:hypothetical protein